LRSEKTHIVLCSDALLPKGFGRGADYSILKLAYDPNSSSNNVNIDLPHFKESLSVHIRDRIKDLLEIAGYIYAADRLIKRGEIDSLEYHAWARNIHFVFKVRDLKFWEQTSTSKLLSEALLYMSGDKQLNFSFIGGAKDIGQLNAFDVEGISPELKVKSTIALFSGGLDSLAGVIQTLETTKDNVILVSHRANHGTTKTQKGIHKKLAEDYPRRIKYYAFNCTLKEKRAAEETQRTRIFLYTAVAFSLASIFKESEIQIFENGMTSINFSKRADLINARASRTTHPKTLHHMSQFFSHVAEKKFKIQHPFLFHTKTDIFKLIQRFNRHNYINSTVTCTKTFQKFNNNTNATHCGGCSQCIDRRFAAFASDLEKFDAIYDFEISKDTFLNEEAKTHLCDYIKLAFNFSNESLDSFYYDKLEVLSELTDYIEGNDDTEKVEKIFILCKKHFQQIHLAVKKILSLEDPLKPKIQNSFFTFIDSREYFKDPVERFIEKITDKLLKVLPEAFNSEKPKNENGLNDFINAFLLGEKDEYYREFPAVKFSFAKTIPDHSYEGHNLFIESKYLRGKTSKSAITDGIAADIIKYPEEKFKLFLIYDPERKISNDETFKKDFERKPKCKICIIR
jgi:7-cyano-7-deazaguanine synthase in queuosine biosynthesis